MTETKTRKFMASRGGVSLELVLGERPDPRNPARSVPITRAEIAQEGKAYDNVAPHLVERYDEGDEHIRSLIQEVDEDGASIGGPSQEEHEELQADYSQAQGRVRELEEEVEGLQKQLEDKDQELTQASSDLDAARGTDQDQQVNELKARVRELEDQLAEYTGSSEGGGDQPAAVGGGGDQIAQLDDEGLKSAGKEAGYPKLGDKNWSELSDDEKREALRQHSADQGGAAGS